MHSYSVHSLVGLVAQVAGYRIFGLEFAPLAALMVAFPAFVVVARSSVGIVVVAGYWPQPLVQN
jgi:hypothetical protein